MVVTLLIMPALSAQVTRREITNPTTPAEDSKPVSPAVPEVYAIEGRGVRVRADVVTRTADCARGN
jgi:hypothetical protein